MSNIKTLCILGALSVTTALVNTPVMAQQVVLDPIIVNAGTGAGTGTQTVPSNARAIMQIQQTPGGVAIVDSKDYEDVYSVGFEETLNLVPGVYAQKRFGEEVRLSIRGSGLSRGFHMRGLSVLQDGIPFNLADGSADFQEADTLNFQRLEVYKGANALQYGATTLGGAVNMVSKTGSSQPGDQIRFEMGSYQTYRANVQSGRVLDGGDVFLSLTGTSSAGYRRHDDQANVKFNSNFGIQLNDKVETRLYISGNVIDQELPGSLSLRDALDNPEKADPSAITTDWQRDIRSVRVANKTNIEINDHHQVDVGAFFNSKNLFHPITPFAGLIDQESLDYGVFAQASGDYVMAGHDNNYRFGMRAHLGDVAARVFQNIGGSRGNLTGKADQKSKNYILYGENNFYMNPQLALVSGAQLSWSKRDLTDHLNPGESDDDIYTAFSPKLGLLYEPNDRVQFFTNISKSHETPTFSELTQAGTVGFTPVQAQNAWTFEFGTRGEYGRFAWDISLYQSWIDGEMLMFTTGGGIPATTFNADDTIHRGAELGWAVRLADDVFAPGDSILWRNAYTYSDYHFDGDVRYGDNDIAGQPRHFYQTAVRYDNAGGWHVGVNWELAGDAIVDYTNTLDAPGYGIVGVDAGYDINDNINVYVDARNVLDKDYVSTFSTTVNAAGNTNVFYPGDGRSVFAGIKIKF